jgi:hypothetical protein
LGGEPAHKKSPFCDFCAKRRKRHFLQKGLDKLLEKLSTGKNNYSPLKKLDKYRFSTLSTKFSTPCESFPHANCGKLSVDNIC